MTTKTQAQITISQSTAGNDWNYRNTFTVCDFSEIKTSEVQTEEFGIGQWNGKQTEEYYKSLGRNIIRIEETGNKWKPIRIKYTTQVHARKEFNTLGQAKRYQKQLRKEKGIK